jgi:POT family proton-dependent oligopeptide transporter
VTATFLGHPRGLATLFFTEMWERFTYYGMRAILVLFLVAQVSHGGFGIDDKTATAIYGLYTAGTYLACLPGGWVADRLIGARRAVLFGGIAITAGNVLLAMSGTPRAFYLALVVVVVGVGLLKPNASAMVADLYPERGARLDAGFTLFYWGINLGATIGPLVTSEAQEHVGARSGFAAAGLFMGLGVLQYYLTQHHLGQAGKSVSRLPGTQAPWMRLWVGVGVAVSVVAACGFGWLSIDPVGIAQTTTALLLGTAVLYFGYLFIGAKLDAEERRRLVVIVVLFIGSACFWSGYEQGGSSLNLFAQRYTDRLLTSIHAVIPTGFFQSLNPAFIIVFAPLVSWLWTAMAKRQLAPSAPVKFAIGLILLGASFLLMAAAAIYVAQGSKVSPNWLVFTYLLQTFGELCLSPVGLSYVSKLSPKSFVGQLMGMWFLSISLGNLAAGLIAGEFDANNTAAMSGQYMYIVYFAVGLGVVLLALSRPVKKLMGEVA